MPVSACGKVCAKILAESRRYKETDRTKRQKGREMQVFAQLCRKRKNRARLVWVGKRQECMNSVAQKQSREAGF